MQQTEVTSLLIQKRVLKLMGNRFELSVVSNDEKWGQQCIDAAISEMPV